MASYWAVGRGTACERELQRIFAVVHGASLAFDATRLDRLRGAAVACRLAVTLQPAPHTAFYTIIFNFAQSSVLVFTHCY